MTCAQCQELLIDLLYGELDAARAAEVELHLAGCAACRVEQQRLAGTRATFAPLFAVAGPLEEPSPAFDGPILVAAREAASASSAKSAAGRPLSPSGAEVIALAGRAPASAERRPAARRRWMRGAVVGSIAAAAALAVVVSIGRGPDQFDARPRSAEEAQSPAKQFAPPPPRAPAALALDALPPSAPAASEAAPLPADAPPGSSRPELSPPSGNTIAAPSAADKVSAAPPVSFAPPPPERAEKKRDARSAVKGKSLSASGETAARELEEASDGEVGGLAGLGSASAGGAFAGRGQVARGVAPAGAGLLGGAVAGPAAGAASQAAAAPVPAHVGPSVRREEDAAPIAAPVAASAQARVAAGPAPAQVAEPAPARAGVPAEPTPALQSPANAQGNATAVSLADSAAPPPTAKPSPHFAMPPTPAQLEAQAFAARGEGRLEQAARFAVAAAQQRLRAGDPSQVELAARDLVDAISCYAQLGRLADARAVREQLAALSPSQDAALADADRAIAAQAASAAAPAVPAATRAGPAVKSAAPAQAAPAANPDGK